MCFSLSLSFPVFFPPSFSGRIPSLPSLRSIHMSMCLLGVWSLCLGVVWVTTHPFPLDQSHFQSQLVVICVRVTSKAKSMPLSTHPIFSLTFAGGFRVCEPNVYMHVQVTIYIKPCAGLESFSPAVGECPQ